MLFLMLGHVLLQCEKLLLGECCLSAVFPYRLHWISSMQIWKSCQTQQENGRRVGKAGAFWSCWGEVLRSASSAAEEKKKKNPDKTPLFIKNKSQLLK